MTSPGFDLSTGHFTEFPWMKSIELGMGHATSQSGSVYIVARYSTPGNYTNPGQFQQNVPRLLN